MSVTAEALTALVEGWLPAQRWFAGKGRDGSVRMSALSGLGPAYGDSGAEVTIWTASVEYTDGSAELYQLPLVEYPNAVAGLEHVLVGSCGGDPADGGTAVRWIYDALHDKDVTAAWLAGIRDATDRSDSSAAGPLRFSRTAEPGEIPVGAPSLVLTVEQSNTSLIFSDVAILKVFRRLQPGVNPDIEIHASLSALGAKHIPRLLGSVSAEVGGERYALAMLQEFMTTATDGWELAKTSVRDLMAEADLHAEEAGGDFAGEAYRLGSAVAEVHGDLAAAFGTGTATAAELRDRAAAMRDRLSHAVAVVPELSELTDGLNSLFAAFGELGEPLPVQRIHGDLHLGQALRTVHRWVIIDFEGEPMAELSARRRPDTVLRDIAAMLRSFSYAGHHRLIETGYEPQLAYRADEWAQRNRDAFCAGYQHASGHDPHEQDVVLRAFEADKAVYEAVYETRHRPPWLAIPLQSLRMLSEAPTQ